MTKNPVKTCSVCKVTKRLDCFYSIGAICKECQAEKRKQYYLKNRDKVRQKQQETYWKDPEKRRKASRDYLARCPEHREKNRIKSLAWHKEHAKEANNKRRQHKELNPEIFTLSKIKTKAKKHGYNIEIVDADITLEKVAARDKNVCYLCQQTVDMSIKKVCRGKATIDHIIPLSKGGVHSWQNVALAHLGCNSSKHTSTLLEFQYKHSASQQLPSLPTAGCFFQ